MIRTKTIKRDLVEAINHYVYMKLMQASLTVHDDAMVHILRFGVVLDSVKLKVAAK